MNKYNIKMYLTKITNTVGDRVWIIKVRTPEVIRDWWNIGMFSWVNSPGERKGGRVKFIIFFLVSNGLDIVVSLAPQYI